MALIDTPNKTIFLKLKTEESSSSSYISSSAWATLPLDVIYLILDKLVEPMDHFYFATICRRWCSVSRDYNLVTQRWQEHKGNHLLPLLIVNNDKEVQLRSVLDENRCYNIHYYGNKCCGSSYGWLATFDQVGDVLSITLVHPLQISVAPIRLPPLNYPKISKVILSDDPNLNPENYSIAALYGTGRNTKLAFLRGGGQETNLSWIYLDKGQTNLKDAIFHKNKIYAVGGHLDRIVSFDCGSKLPKAKPQSANGQICFEGSRFYYVSASSYLVESTNGDHLWHVRTLVSRLGTELSVSFKVYKVALDDKDGSVVEQVPVESIGDEALFLGGVSHSRSVLASNFPGCQPNSIYYTPDEPYNVQHPDGKPYHIFSLEDTTPTEYTCYHIYNIHDPCSHTNTSNVVWALPMFKGLASNVC